MNTKYYASDDGIGSTENIGPINPVLQLLRETTSDNLVKYLDLELDSICELMTRSAQMGYRYLNLETKLRLRPNIVSTLYSWGFSIDESNNTKIIWGTLSIEDHHISPHTSEFLNSLQPEWQIHLIQKEN